MKEVIKTIWFYKFTDDGKIEESERELKIEGPFFSEEYEECYIKYIEQPNNRTGHKVWRRLLTDEGEVTHLRTVWLSEKNQNRAVSLLIEHERGIIEVIKEEINIRRYRIKKMKKLIK